MVKLELPSPQISVMVTHTHIFTDIEHVPNVAIICNVECYTNLQGVRACSAHMESSFPGATE